MPIENPSSNSIRRMAGLGELAISQDPNISLCTQQIGAGLGVAIYDPVAKVGGLLHTLLPTSEINPKLAAERPALFLDAGLTALLEGARKLQAAMNRIRVYVAGGAQIMDEASQFSLGRRNFDSLLDALAKHGVTLHAHQVGGRTACSMELIVATGEVRLKFSGQHLFKLLCKPPTTS